MVDAYDVLATKGLTALEGKFKEMEEKGTKVLFAGDKASYPDLGIVGLYKTEGEESWRAKREQRVEQSHGECRDCKPF